MIEAVYMQIRRIPSIFFIELLNDSRNTYNDSQIQQHRRQSIYLIVMQQDLF